jgi:transcriptional regulator with PAS, ATPase and Fis domain
MNELYTDEGLKEYRDFLNKSIKEHIIKTLTANKGQFRKTCRDLKMSISSIQYWCKKLNINHKDYIDPNAPKTALDKLKALW